jgi:hypothetical protein
MPRELAELRFALVARGGFLSGEYGKHRSMRIGDHREPSDRRDVGRHDLSARLMACLTVWSTSGVEM